MKTDKQGSKSKQTNKVSKQTKQAQVLLLEHTNIQLWSRLNIRAGCFRKGGGFVQICQVNLSQGMSPDDLSSYL